MVESLIEPASLLANVEGVPASLLRNSSPHAPLFLSLVHRHQLLVCVYQQKRSRFLPSSAVGQKAQFWSSMGIFSGSLYKAS